MPLNSMNSNVVGFCFLYSLNFFKNNEILLMYVKSWQWSLQIQKLYMFIFKLSFCQITWQIINVPTRGNQVLCTNGDNYKFKIPFLHILFFLQVCGWNLICVIESTLDDKACLVIRFPLMTCSGDSPCSFNFGQNCSF